MSTTVQRVSWLTLSVYACLTLLAIYAFWPALRSSGLRSILDTLSPFILWCCLWFAGLIWFILLGERTTLPWRQHKPYVAYTVVVVGLYITLLFFYREAFLIIGVVVTPVTFCGIVMRKPWKNVMLYGSHLLLISLILVRNLPRYSTEQQAFTTYSVVDGFGILMIVGFILTSFVLSERTT